MDKKEAGEKISDLLYELLTQQNTITKKQDIKIRKEIVEILEKIDEDK